MWKGPAETPAALEQAKQAGQAANRSSLLHQLDLFCRKQISDTMQQLKTELVSMAFAPMKRLIYAMLMHHECATKFALTVLHDTTVLLIAMLIQHWLVCQHIASHPIEECVHVVMTDTCKCQADTTVDTLYVSQQMLSWNSFWERAMHLTLSI